MTDLIERNSVKRNLAVGYLLPVLCILAFSTSNSAMAAHNKHNDNEGLSGAYIGIAGGMISGADASKTFLPTSLTTGIGGVKELNALSMQPMGEVRVGYTFGLGNFLIPIEAYAQTGFLAVPNNLSVNPAASGMKTAEIALNTNNANFDLQYQYGVGARIRPGFAVTDDFSVNAIFGVAGGMFLQLGSPVAANTDPKLDTTTGKFSIGGSYGIGAEYKVAEAVSLRAEWINTIFYATPAPVAQIANLSKAVEATSSAEYKVAATAPSTTVPVVLSNFMIGVSVYPFNM